MAYKFSKGTRGLGDITFEDDSDTGIDFEQDTIKLQTSGSTRLTIENDVITTTVPIHISGSVTEGLRIGKAGNEYREIQFETDGVDTAFIQVDSSEGLIIGCQSVNDEIIFHTTDGNGTAEKMRIEANGNVGIGTTSPDTTLHVEGDTILNGRTIIQTTGSETPSEFLNNESISFYLDEDANELKVRVKYSDGVLKTGTIGLS